MYYLSIIKLLLISYCSMIDSLIPTAQSIVAKKKVHAKERKIAITIDDAPFGDSALFKGTQRLEKILKHLSDHNNTIAGFFLIGQHMDLFGLSQVSMIDTAGHAICNHTYSHLNLRKTDVNLFINDIEKMHDKLKSYQNFAYLFRYPFLEQGGHIKYAQVQEKLLSLGYINAKVTINNCDYYLANLLNKAIKAGKTINYDKLRALYIELMLDCISHFERWYIVRGQDDIAHVLLMHLNDLTALFLGDLLTVLKENNWAVLSVHDAYTYQTKTENTLTLTSMERKTLAAKMPKEPKTMNIKYLKARFEEVLE